MTQPIDRDTLESLLVWHRLEELTADDGIVKATVVDGAGKLRPHG